MFPPIEESVLQNNPDFAALYHTLTAAILNPDGTTKGPGRAKEEAIQEELNHHRTQTAKHHLLVQTICSLAPPPPTTSRSSSPPDAEFQDLLLLLPPLLDPSPGSPVPPDLLLSLLSHPPLSNIDAHLPQLGRLVSSSLVTQASALARIASPGTNPSFLHRAIPSVAPHVEKLARDLEQATLDLGAERARAASTAVGVLRLQAQAQALLVRALEAKHGISARSLELRAAETGLSARLAEAATTSALARAQKEVYGKPGVAEAMGNYAQHLDREIELERERIRRARAQLDSYGVGVEGGEERERMAREMARVWGEMGAEIQAVKRDMERLEK